MDGEIARNWTCARCWIREGEADAVEVIPAATLTAITEMLEANPTVQGVDILREIQKGDMHLRVGTFGPRGVDPLTLESEESARFAEIVAHKRTIPAEHPGGDTQ